MKNTVQNETESYALGFGEKSKFDETTLEIFKEYAAKTVGETFNGKDPRSYFQIIQDFNKIVEDLDKAFVWSKAHSNEEAQNQKRWTAMVFGECGQGKSTTLNEIVKIVADKYYKG